MNAYRGTHDALPDPRNEEVLIYINGDLVPRNEAKISVFDSGFLVGDGVWEGIRLQDDTLVFLDDHLDRLYGGAKAIALDIGLTRSELTEAIHKTLRAKRYARRGSCSPDGVPGGQEDPRRKTRGSPSGVPPL